ncbi:MAG: malectin domain-containing carbohydrate-binding protein, partial [Candidatus Omnitrophota bacterium]|nr:malectin domain-containing carbohydrate-binding protein [Candidatus Omnitrophota bacterium]
MSKKLLSTTGITTLILLTASSFSFAFEKHINCGGNSYTALNGDVYIADQQYSVENAAGYVNGNQAATGDPIEDTEDDPLYQTERWGVSEYKFDAPNGFYDVKLKFAETYFNEVNKRVFSVSLEDNLVIENLDIYALTGHDRALDYSFTVRVTDSQLNITAQASVDASKFSAISIVSSEEPPSAISGKITLQGSSNHSAQVSFILSSLITSLHDCSCEFTTDSEGSYTIANLMPGIYNISAKTFNSLKTTEVLIKVHEAETTPNIDFILRGGDTDGNNVVNIFDHSILNMAFGSSPGDDNWDERADFDRNGVVNIFDHSIMNANFGKDGREPEISITSPEEGDTVNAPTIPVSGTIDNNNALVTVNDVTADIADNLWTAQGIPLAQ